MLITLRLYFTAHHTKAINFSFAIVITFLPWFPKTPFATPCQVHHHFVSAVPYGVAVVPSVVEKRGGIWRSLLLLLMLLAALLRLSGSAAR